MASGPEMMLNTVLKMFGVTTESAKADIARAVTAVLSFDDRLAQIEDNQRRIMAALNVENDDEQSGNSERSDDYPGRSVHSQPEPVARLLGNQ